MKKILKYFLITLVIVSCFYVPKYYELNNISIIDGVGVEKKDEIYTLYLREVIPSKEDSNLTFKYKVYEASSSNLEDLLPKITKKTKKKLYLNKVKFLITNINSSKIIKKFNIKPKTIYHTKNIKKEIKDY